MSEHEFEIPPVGAQIADTHAHLDMLADPVGALVRAARADVGLVVTVVDPTEDIDTTFSGLEAWLAEARALLLARGTDAEPSEPPEVRIILGAHPHNAKDVTDSTLERMRELARDARVVGIGEIGLDYHYDHSPREVQRRMFARQLELASELELPVIVHLREAHDDGEAIMRDVGLPDAGCILHCFTGDRELLERFRSFDCYVSFAGPVTFKKADAIREAAGQVPLDRILVETDCPFMAPEPYRGRKNEPAFAVFNAIRLAEVTGMRSREFATRSTENARRLLGGA